MPKNVTVYLPDEVVTEMEKYPEVSWSEICRDAIINYVTKRDKGFDVSKIRFLSVETGAGDFSFDNTSRPVLMPRFKISNGSDFDINLDRIIYDIKIRIGAWEPMLCSKKACLERINILKGREGQVEDYLEINSGIIKEISDKIGDKDIYLRFKICGYFDGPPGSFVVSGDLSERIPNSDWKKNERRWRLEST